MSLDLSQPSFAHSRHLEQCRKNMTRLLSGNFSDAKRQEAWDALQAAEKAYAEAVAREARQ